MGTEESFISGITLLNIYWVTGSLDICLPRKGILSCNYVYHLKGIMEFLNPRALG